MVIIENMSDDYIEFENGSKINCIKPEESSKGTRNNMILYYSDAYKRYHTIKGIWEMCKGLKWYQKIYVVLWSKWIDLKDYYTDPHVKAMRRFFK